MPDIVDLVDSDEDGPVAKRPAPPAAESIILEAMRAAVGSTPPPPPPDPDRKQRLPTSTALVIAPVPPARPVAADFDRVRRFFDSKIDLLKDAQNPVPVEIDEDSSLPEQQVTISDPISVLATSQFMATYGHAFGLFRPPFPSSASAVPAAPATGGGKSMEILRMLHQHKERSDRDQRLDALPPAPTLEEMQLVFDYFQLLQDYEQVRDEVYAFCVQYQQPMPEMSDKIQDPEDDPDEDEVIQVDPPTAPEEDEVVHVDPTTPAPQELLENESVDSSIASIPPVSPLVLKYCPQYERYVNLHAKILRVDQRTLNLYHKWERFMCMASRALAQYMLITHSFLPSRHGDSDDTDKNIVQCWNMIHNLPTAAYSASVLLDPVHLVEPEEEDSTHSKDHTAMVTDDDRSVGEIVDGKTGASDMPGADHTDTKKGKRRSSSSGASNLDAEKSTFHSLWEENYGSDAIAVQFPVEHSGGVPCALTHQPNVHTWMAYASSFHLLNIFLNRSAEPAPSQPHPKPHQQQTQQRRPSGRRSPTDESDDEKQKPRRNSNQNVAQNQTNDPSLHGQHPDLVAVHRSPLTGDMEKHREVMQIKYQYSGADMVALCLRARRR
jgi:hypothetical protein